ncbi:M20 metallopeptidase family protein [Propionibacteriaceae bacterium Y2011]
MTREDRRTFDPAALIELRRHLHANPELRFTERETQAHLQQLLGGLEGLAIEPIAETGLLVHLPDRGPGPSVLLRADMDAYPVTETSGVPFSSRRDGVAHMCGHDIHMTILVGVIDALLSAPPSAGRVTALFQPAEEIPYGQASGAATVVATGRLDDHYDAVLGLHVWPDLPGGTVGVNSPISMAAKDAFQIEVRGVGAHVASAYRGRDAILAASSLVTSLHASMNRRRAAPDMLGFNIGTIHGGASQSLVAPSVEMTGTIRTHDDRVSRQMRALVEDIAAGTARSYDVEVEVTWDGDIPAVVNHPALIRAALGLAEDGLTVTELPRSPMTADDFAWLTRLGPGLYLKLGTATATDPEPAPLHSPDFLADEGAIEVGVTALTTLTRRVLAGEVSGLTCESTTPDNPMKGTV